MARLFPVLLLLPLFPWVLPLPPPPPANGEGGMGTGGARAAAPLPACAYWLPAHALGSHWRVPHTPRARALLGGRRRWRRWGGARSPGGSSPPCPPDRFQCYPGAACFPGEWRCDGHPDCKDEGDERGCGTASPAEPSPEGTWVTPPRSSGEPPAAGGGEASATPAPGGSVPSRSQGRTWVLIIAVLLSILLAVGSLAVWGLSKAKGRSDVFSLERASREQLMPDESQTGSLP